MNFCCVTCPILLLVIYDRPSPALTLSQSFLWSKEIQSLISATCAALLLMQISITPPYPCTQLNTPEGNQKGPSVSFLEIETLKLQSWNQPSSQYWRGLMWKGLLWGIEYERKEKGRCLQNTYLMTYMLIYYVT